MTNQNLKKIINSAIKKESFILNKNSMEIQTDSRIAAALNSSSMIQLKFPKFILDMNFGLILMTDTLYL